MGEHYIEFKYHCCLTKKEIVHRFDGDIDLDGVTEEFAAFVRGMGYPMPGKEIVIKEKNNG